MYTSPSVRKSNDSGGWISLQTPKILSVVISRAIDMEEHKAEADLITAVVDLAASRREPLNRYGDYEEWLTFDSITDALVDICKQLGVHKHLEQSCFQALLRMSAESERHLTWWEKIEQIDRYLNHPKPNHKKDAHESKHAIPCPTPQLMRVVEPERSFLGRTITSSSIDPSTLREADQLSMLLNDTFGFQAQYSTLSSKKTTTTHITYKDRNTSSSTYRDTGTPFSTGPTSQSAVASVAGSSRKHISFSDVPRVQKYEMWRAVDEKLAGIEEESHAIKDNIEHLLNSSRAAPATPHRSAQDDSTIYGRGNWTLSPSVIHHDTSALVADTPMAAPADAKQHPGSGITAPVLQPPPPPSLSTSTTTEVKQDSSRIEGAAIGTSMAESAKRARNREFSDLLRSSGAMSKYLGLSRVRSPGSAEKTSPRRAKSASPPRSAPLVAPPRPAPVESPTTRGVPTGKKALFDSPTQPTPPPKHHHQSKPTSSRTTVDSSDGVYTPGFVRSGIAPFVPYTPSKVVPWVLQGQHGGGGVYTPEGHINVDALDFDPRVLQRGGYAHSNADPDALLAAEEEFIGTITSTTRILIIFHRWLLARSDHNNIHFGDDRNSALMLAAHFGGVDDFVSSLFGLEQWLRDKMRLIVNTEAKAYVFRTWNLKYGVSAQSRLFWRRRRLHSGFESFLEFGMKRRMHRKNALHALAARRRHTNVSHMAPILRHRPARLHPREDGDSDAGDASALSQSERGLSDLSRLNKYSTLDMTMFNVSQRQEAKRAHYLTSLSIRDIVLDAKSALLTFSRGGNNEDAFRVKTREYLQAQDTVALLFAFRRLYHRSIYITRQRRVRLLVRRSCLANVMTMWKSAWSAVATVEKALEPRVQRVLEEMKYVKKQLALRKLRTNVHWSRRDREKLQRFATRIRSKPVYLRAVHTIRCAAFVKCFLVLKQNYISYSPTVAEQRRSDQHRAAYSARFALRLWHLWYRSRSAARRRGLRSDSARRSLMGLLLHRAQIWHLVQPNKHSAATSMSTDTFFDLPAVRNMHLTKDILTQTVHHFQLRRALHRLSSIGRSARIYFSLGDLRLAQALCHTKHAAERRKYLHLVNEASCRILPPSSRREAKLQFARVREATFRQPGSASAPVARLTAEKPYQLISAHPHTLHYYLRTIRAPTEASSESARTHAAGAAPSVLDLLKKRGDTPMAAKRASTATLDGTLLSNAPQLLRSMRKWRQLCRGQGHLRKLAQKVQRKMGLVLLREKFEEWAAVFRQERECKRVTKGKAMVRFRALLARSHVTKRANRLVQRGLALSRHWHRLVAAHVHHTELRRMQAGHFYNSVMSGSTRKVLNFVANHSFVPFSVRHFLSHYPAYRFPIYRPYDGVGWEHSFQGDAYQALLVLCEHFHVYGHEHHLVHHLEMFHHLHHEEFSAIDPNEAHPVAHGRVDLFPHTYASPALRAASENTARARSHQGTRPMHLTPGAMLSDQPFSVSADIGSRYRRSAEMGGYPGNRSRSSSPQKPRSQLSIAVDTPYASNRTGFAVRNQGTANLPGTTQLAAAAIFMSHWMSECLKQYYALRRGLFLLRKFARRRRRQYRLLRGVFLAKAKVAVDALCLNRRDCKLTKVIQHRRLGVFSRRLRILAVQTRARRTVLRKVLGLMHSTYRYRLILRTWEGAWRTKTRCAWEKLVAFTSKRGRIVSRLQERINRRVLLDTVRVMCCVTTANLWRRRRARVAGLHALVTHYNRNVRAMDRDETVRMYATAKHFTALTDNLLSLLKQRLSAIVAMNYRKKNALVRGFMAIAGNVRQPQREIREDVLRERMHAALFSLRRQHESYEEHRYRSYGTSASAELTIKIKNTFNSFREKQLLSASAERQKEFQRRGSYSPYLSSTIALPSPVPPSHTLDTPLRRTSMLAPREPPARVTHDTLSGALESEDSDDAADASASAPRRSVSTKQSGTERRSTSAAHMLFGAIGTSSAHSLRSDRRSVVDNTSRSSVSVTMSSAARNTTATADETASTISAMAERRQSLRAALASRASTSDLASDVRSVASTLPSRSERSRSTLGAPSFSFSPYLPRSRRANTGDADRPGSSAQQSFRPGQSMTSTINTSFSIASSTKVSRRSSLHDAHADVVDSFSSTRLAGELDAPPAASQQVNPRGLPSILITSPAYSAAPRSLARVDSRINFRDPSAETVASNIDSRTPRRASNNNGASVASRRGGGADRNDTDVDNLQPFSPVTQYSVDDTPRAQGNFFFDDASTEVSTVRETESVRSGFGKIQRKRSVIHAQRSEETTESMLLLERGMKRGLFSKWRRNVVFARNMRSFCERYVRMRALRVNLHIFRRQVALDRQQRRLLQRIDKQRALAILNAHVQRCDENRQVTEFAEKYYIVMAIKLALRRWRSRVKKTTASSWHYRSAEHFSKKRRCTLFLLNLRASCVPAASVEAALKSSPERMVAPHKRSAVKPGARAAKVRESKEWDYTEEVRTTTNGGGRRVQAALTPGAISALLRK